MRLFLGFFLTVVVARACGAECPANTVEVLGDTYTTSAPRDAADRYRSGCIPHPYYCWQAIARTSYDLVAGTASVTVNGGGVTASASVSTHDVFTLLGPPSPSPITFTAQAHVVLFLGCWGMPPSASVSIREGASNVAEVSLRQCGADVVTDIGVSITRQAGELFDLHMTAMGQGGEFNSGGNADLWMGLSFPDLPAGYSVVSCQGYSSAPVATRQGSWGALKTLYR